jgi:hypothetical protein
VAAEVRRYERATDQTQSGIAVDDLVPGPFITRDDSAQELLRLHDGRVYVWPQDADRLHAHENTSPRGER